MQNAEWLPVGGGVLAALFLFALFMMCLDLLGVLPVSQHERADRRERTRLHYRVAEVQARHQPGQTPQTLHYAPHYAALPPASPASTPLPALPEAAEPELPGPGTLLDVMRQTGFTPSHERILLGQGPGGTLLTVPADETLCHILIAGLTGGGKSALFRLLLVQLLAAGVPAYLLDLAFAPYDSRRRIDRRPIAARLAAQPLTDPAHIARFFEYLAGPELTKRKTAMQTTGDPGDAFFVFADEWPQLMDTDKDRIAPPARHCLRLYRQYGGYFAIGAQDALVDTMGNNSGVLAQFPTGYYVGGDVTTRRRVTGLAGQVPEPAGKGLVYLRAAVQTPAALVRVPYVGNPDVYELLGAPDTPPPWGWEGVTRRWPGATIVDATARSVEAATSGAVGVEAVNPPPTPQAQKTPPSASPASPVEADPRAARIAELLQQGIGPAGIVKDVWGVTGGNAYKVASAELTAILAAWAAEATARREGNE